MQNAVWPPGLFALSSKCTNSICAKARDHKTWALQYFIIFLCSMFEKCYCILTLLKFCFFKRPIQLLQVQVPKWTDTELKLPYQRSVTIFLCSAKWIVISVDSMQLLWAIQYNWSQDAFIEHLVILEIWYPGVLENVHSLSCFSVNTFLCSQQ